eukprot:gene17500-19250_t
MSGIKTLLHPYYLTNIFACLLYIIAKSTTWICRRMFSEEEVCEIDWMDQEILIFLGFVIVIKNRRWKPVQWTEYASNVFMFAKGANALLFFRKDVRLSVAYMIICLAFFFVAPEPKYKGPENITYFRGQALEEELMHNPRSVYVVEFFASWSTHCTHFSEVFSKISLGYDGEYLKFGKLDVGRYPVVAKKFNVDTSVTSKQLPTIILFENGKEKIRRPIIDKKQTVWTYVFKSENIIKDFNLNEYLDESKKKSKNKSKPENKVEQKSKTD